MARLWALLSRCEVIHGVCCRAWFKDVLGGSKMGPVKNPFYFLLVGNRDHSSKLLSFWGNRVLCTRNAFVALYGYTASRGQPCSRTALHFSCDRLTDGQRYRLKPRICERGLTKLVLFMVHPVVLVNAVVSDAALLRMTSCSDDNKWRWRHECSYFTVESLRFVVKALSFFAWNKVVQKLLNHYYSQDDSAEYDAPEVRQPAVGH